MDRDAFEALQALNKAARVDPNLGTGQEEVAQPGMQFGFDVVEVQKVGLALGDVLMVTVKNDELSQESVDQLRKQLQLVFPENKVFVFAMGTADDVQLQIVSKPEEPVASCGPVGYCGDCNCGKKRRRKMAKILKLTDGIDGRDTELVNVDAIKSVECVGGDFRKANSKIHFIDGNHTYVKETPDQIYEMINPEPTKTIDLDGMEKTS